ncbi:MAG: rhodanese-like domain-containing protein [Chloroflexi bacterium]|nr:rhodanese-like domain-containing protein [Chloroflexota bacterium]
MTSRNLALIIALLISVWLAGCGGPASTPAAESAGGGVPVLVGGGSYTNITSNQLAAMLDDSSADFLFVNVHVPYEGEIEQTDAFIAYEDGSIQRIDEYPADKSANIVLYCRSGRMSAIVAESLVKAGYTNVWNLDGGMVAWKQAGYEVIHK